MQYSSTSLLLTTTYSNTSVGTTGTGPKPYICEDSSWTVTKKKALDTNYLLVNYSLPTERKNIACLALKIVKLNGKGLENWYKTI